jgi:MFS family permease
MRRLGFPDEVQPMQRSGTFPTPSPVTVAAAASTTDTSWPPARTGWTLVALLTLAYALAILDRVSISLLIQPLQAAMNLDDTQFGLLQGMAFSLVYSLLGLPLGMLADRSNRKRLLIGGVVLWSLATISCGFARNFTELFVARMLVGIGEAALVPVAASLIADYFSPTTRPKAYGVFVGGSSLGTAAAMGLGGVFIVTAAALIASFPRLLSGMAPWQMVFVQCGAPGLVLAAAMAIMVREPERRGVEARAPRISILPLLALFRSEPSAFGTLMGGTVLNLVCVYALIGWFPALFIRVHGWSAQGTGWTLGAVGLPISLFAAVNSGWVIVWLTRRGLRQAPMLAAATSGLSLMVFGTIACLTSSGAVALAAYAVNALFLNWNMSSVYSGLSQIAPNNLRAQVMSIHTILSGLVALTAGNLIVGLLSDQVFTGPHGIGPSLAAVFLFCGGGAAAVLLSGAKAFRAAAERADARASALASH